MNNETVKAVSVPEATDRMIEAGCAELHNSLHREFDFDHDLHGGERESEIVSAIYKAMLTAAPEPEQDGCGACGDGCTSGACRVVTDEMVSRFLGWKLPSDFGPDCGISFDRQYAEKWSWPIGTNLFTAGQARAMLEHVLAAAPQQAASEGCKTCGGTGHVDDGELTHSEGGIPYLNGPIKCIKDCPACAKQGVQQAVSVPEGWKLVPIEPTRDMIIELARSEFPGDLAAGKCLQLKKGFVGDKMLVPPNVECEMAVGKYARMLAAAPSPEQTT